MRIQQLVFAFCITLIFPSALFAAPPEAKCHGDTTLLYSNPNLDLSICHGDYVKINPSKLNQWQNCVDSMLLITDKKQKRVSALVDCSPTKTLQFKIDKDNLLQRIFYVEYPKYVEKPLLIESTSLVSLAKQYTFLRRFPNCQKKEIDQATREIEITKAKPFAGSTFFSSIYGNFYKLRDCANSFPAEILAVLTDYQQRKIFDGEVSETLNDVINEVRLIAAAKQQN